MKIRVLSYNIHRAIGIDRRFAPERIVEILKGHDADIVLLQEVDEGAPRSRELELAKELAEAYVKTNMKLFELCTKQGEAFCKGSCKSKSKCKAKTAKA